MSLFDLHSCRICLAPDSAFVSVFGSFHERSVEEIILEICGANLNRDERLPQCVCENCFTKLLHADSIRTLCKRNESFLTTLVGACLEQEVIEEEFLILESNDMRDQNTIVEETFMEPPEDSVKDSVIDTEKQSNLESTTLEKVVTNNFFCSQCFKEFNTRAKCMYHEKTKHAPKPAVETERKFTCDRCGTKFKQKSHVINHLNVVHLRIKRFHCNICGFAMYSKTHYTLHIKTHSSIKEFRCAECGKDFSRKETLLVHQRTHSNARPYKCKYCDKSYTSHTDLKRHIFSHTRVHPYICQLCRKGFFLKRLLCGHVNNVHPGIDTTSWLNGRTFHNF